MVVKKERKKNLHKNDLEKKQITNYIEWQALNLNVKKCIKRVICICTLKKCSFSICIFFLWMCVGRFLSVAEKMAFSRWIVSRTQKNAPRDYLSKGKNAEFCFFIRRSIENKISFVDMQNSISWIQKRIAFECLKLNVSV